jgi:hypothetical protein
MSRSSKVKDFLRAIQSKNTDQLGISGRVFVVPNYLRNKQVCVIPIEGE